MRVFGPLQCPSPREISSKSFRGCRRATAAQPWRASLVPSTGGVFRVEIDGTCVWDRVEQGGFPDAKTLKRLVRDVVWPERDLGHVDRVTAPKEQG